MRTVHAITVNGVITVQVIRNTRTVVVIRQVVLELLHRVTAVLIRQTVAAIVVIAAVLGVIVLLGGGITYPTQILRHRHTRQRESAHQHKRRNQRP